ncbi:MAG: T9SS type A sorting domain-containing protein [Saprospiraceae bacterium]
MKGLTTILIFCFGINFLLAQPTLHWSEPDRVSDNSRGISSSRIGVLENGDPIIMWGNSNGRSIQLARVAGDTIQETLSVSAGGITPRFFSFAGLDLATHADSVYIVFESSGSLYLSKSADAGLSFYPPVLAFDPPDNKIATLSSIVADDAGNPIISTLWENANETEAKYVTIKSSDGGFTFDPFVVASDSALGTYVCECCPSDMATIGDEIYLAFRNNTGSRRDIWVSKSVDGGQSYLEVADVDDTDWQINSCPISKPSILEYGQDSLLVAFHSGASGKGRVYISQLDKSSMQATASFQMPLLNPSGSQEQPVLAGKGDTLCMVWIENGFSGTGSDLMFAYSVEGFAGLKNNFQKVKSLNQNQDFPEISYSRGVFHLIFEDNSGLHYIKGEPGDLTSYQNPLADPFDFKIYPQPAFYNQFWLSLEGDPTVPFQIDLFDVNGKLIQSWKDKSGNTLELQTTQNLKGVYYLNIAQGKKVGQKVVVFE